jgi:hypothetical protein
MGRPAAAAPGAGGPLTGGYGAGNGGLRAINAGAGSALANITVILSWPGFSRSATVHPHRRPAGTSCGGIEQVHSPFCFSIRLRRSTSLA